MESDLARPSPPPNGALLDVSSESSRIKKADYREFVDSLTYLDSAEVQGIEEAYAFSEQAHRDQKRLSGEPYITHPLAVAQTLSEWRLDAQVIIAALLHDVMEDTSVTKAEITERFGQTIAEMVDGLSKLGKISFPSYREAQAENFRKMLMAMARDLRIVLIKLADRLHNLRTMSVLRLDKRRRIARETLEIYVPIATRLGLNNISRQLEDLSFEQIYPRRYRTLARAMEAVHGNRSALLSSIFEGIRGATRNAKIDANVFGREKSLYSIYRKMVENHLNFSQVLDIYTFQVIVRDTPTCYLALGALHAVYKPVPGKFNDYIAIPRQNGYQSLHTTLIGPHGTPIEVRIRTQEMHRVAEDGIASHWLHKDGAKLRMQTHQWLKALLDLQTPTGNSSEFFEYVKFDLFPDEVYVFTPKGKILALPHGATVIDFAYAVHTDIGHRCVAAHIDQKLMPLSTELFSGNQVEILTSPTAKPSPVWLSYVKTGRARSKIRHFLKSAQPEGENEVAPELLNVRLRISVRNARGILSLIANSISRAGVNIERADMSRESLGLFRDIYFIVQVSGRRQLADLMRALRRIPEVVRIAREQG